MFFMVYHIRDNNTDSFEIVIIFFMEGTVSICSIKVQSMSTDGQMNGPKDDCIP